ncbi:MAG: 4-hydroxybenzoate octaprenyltransferase [Gammaproteobacteria bacterium]|nr:4-hydroxybenzoate octaprenyltransferase [Gammaproteobacteria bacterium]
MRVEKPIGWLLLLWPTLIALWLAGEGQPDASIVWIFVAGVFVMRCAGCVINDYADRDIDPAVDRTRTRPLAAGDLRPQQALGLFIILSSIALLLLLQLPMPVWPWAVPAMGLTIIYPFMKRLIQAPQLVLGMAFSFGIPMAYVALEHPFDSPFWLLLLTNLVWVVMYDTAYAMSDREDDLKIGVNSTAILLGAYDRLAIGLAQLTILILLLAIMLQAGLTVVFLWSLLLVSCLFVYQQYLIRARDRADCFAAFINNGWVGAIIWFGLVLALPQN